MPASSGGEARRYPVRGGTGCGGHAEPGPGQAVGRDLIGTEPAVEVEVRFDSDEQFGAASRHRAQDGPVPEAQLDAGVDRPGSVLCATDGR